MKRLVCIFAVACSSLAAPAHAQTSFNARTWLFTQNVTRAASEARLLQWFQGESLELNIIAREETNVLHQLGPLDLSATNLLHVWECAAETNIHTVFFAVTGTVQDATNGHVIYRVTPAGANLLAGNYFGFARVLQNVNGTNVRMGVLQQQRMQVIESVDSELYDVVGPISSTDYVQRIDYGGQSGATPQITRTNNVINIRWPAAGAGDMLTSTYDTNANGVVDNAEALGGTAASAYATDAELTAATNTLGTTIGTKIGASGVTFENADANGDVGTGSDQFARGSAVTTEAVIRATADTQLAGLWQSNRITFAGTTISNVCGWSLNIVYGTNVNSMQSTGCVAYLNIADTNGPAAAGGVATNYVVGFNGTNYSGTGIVFAVSGSITNVVVSNEQIVVQSKDDTAAGSTNTWNVASFPIYNRTDWTGQWAIVESGSTFGQDMTLVLWEFWIPGGTQTVDLLDFATTGAYTTNTAALLVVGYTSVVPSVTTLSAGHHLGVKLYDGANWTNRLIGGVRGRP